MRTRIMCGWCHEMTDLIMGGPTFCPHCGHRADLPRMVCDCPQCDLFRLKVAMDRLEREEND
jgi:hypothetical protein